MKVRTIWHWNSASFFIYDYILLYTATICAFKLSPRYPLEILDGVLFRPELQFVGYGMPLFMTIGLQLAGLQDRQAGFRSTETVARTMAGIAGGLLTFVLLHALVKFELVGRIVLIIDYIYASSFIICSRLLLFRLAEHSRRHILVYGSEQMFEMLTNEVAASRRPIRLVRLHEFEMLAGSPLDQPGEMQRNALYLRCEAEGIQEVIVEVHEQLSKAERAALLACSENGIIVADVSYFYEREFRRVYINGLKESWFWSYDIAHSHPLFLSAKRVLDLAVSIVGIMLLVPLVPVLSLAIKIQDGGPVIYSQRRVGLYGKIFWIYKFRTMRVDAEVHGAQWAMMKDARTTRLGRVLRKTRLDEVPQFWNILRGDMSFIGPRPERPEMYDKIEKTAPFYRYRNMIKPGLTGWAQINYPYGASLRDAAEKLSYDLYYIKYASATKELQIALRTIVAMVKGAR